MATKKKVLIFVLSGVGGAERVSVTIGKNLDSEFFDVFYYAVGPWICEISDFISPEHFRGHLRYSNPIKLLACLYKTIRKESPDIIFTSVMYISTKLLLLQPFFRATKFIVRSENNFFSFNKRQQWMIRFLYRRAENVITQTDEMRIEFVEKAHLPVSKVVTIQNPQDFEMISELAQEPSPFKDSSKKYFVASGRFAYQKGFDILVQAFALVSQKIKEAELYIVGRNSGPNETCYTQICNLINKMGMKEKIHRVGYQKNPYVYVKNADCFVLSSRSEGLPNVLIEALYLGTPAAAVTCIPAIARIVAQGKTGCLAKPENVNSLAEAMLNAVQLRRIQSDYPMDTTTEFNRLFLNIGK
jgi:glycosyltransferase involved in cell wall biosynthesis